MGRRRWSGPGPYKRRDPQPVGATLKNWLSGTGAAKQLARATLFDRWADIVGPEIADRCEPVSLVDGELVLQAVSTAWATQLRLLTGTIQQRINAQVGRGTVTRIRTKGPAGPSWRFGNRHVPGRGPRDTYG
jgi:predicted nucleic acid-binding Zn ribbon protein